MLGVLLVLALLVLLLAGVALYNRGRACLRRRTVDLPLALGPAFERCLACLRELPLGARLTRVDRDAGALEAELGLPDMGEVVSLELEALAADRTRVRIASWSSLPTTLLDGGRNEANVSLLAGELPRGASATPGAAIAVRASGLGRCPFCHEDVDACEATACVACLARHHPACWDEHGACAACGGAERFAGVERAEGGRAREGDA